MSGPAPLCKFDLQMVEMKRDLLSFLARFEKAHSSELKLLFRMPKLDSNHRNSRKITGINYFYFIF